MGPLPGSSLPFVDPRTRRVVVLVALVAMVLVVAFGALLNTGR